MSPEPQSPEPEFPESESPESEHAEIEPTAPRAGWPILAAAIVMGFFYSYYEWEALSSLLILPGLYAQNAITVSSSLWVLLVTGVVLPVLVFVLAVFLGRRRTFFERLVLLVVGFAVVAATSLGILDLGGLV